MGLRRCISSFGALRSRILLLPVCVAYAMSATASEIELPLLKQAKALQCAQTQTQASTALSHFWGIEDVDLNLPSEEQGDETSFMHAATLDIILSSLVSTAERFPELRNQAERTMLQWDYCDVFADGVPYDLQRGQSVTQRVKAVYKAPGAWQGFRALGFFGETESRFIPDIISLDQKNLRADYEQLFHRIYREQCFPHPDTAKLFDITEFGLPAKLSPNVVGESKSYPHVWDPECIYPREAPELKTQFKLEVIPLLVPQVNTSVRIEAVPLLVPRLQTELTVKPDSILVPGLNSMVKIDVVEQLVPTLNTSVMLKAVKQLVPLLNTNTVIDVTEVAVPELKSTLEIVSVPQSIPALRSEVMIEEVKLDIPKLATELLIIEELVDIPALSSRVEFDQASPKVFVKPTRKPAPVMVASAGRTIGGYDGGRYTAAVATSAPARVMVQPTIKTAPTVIVDKDAPLLERLLSHLNGGNNILVIDKIQLTVNEYNGTVETAISSSDIGTTAAVTELDKASLIKELVGFDRKKGRGERVAAQQVQTARVSKIKAEPLKSNYLKVPPLESILLVSSLSQSPAPKAIVIGSPTYKALKVPSLHTQLSIDAKKYPVKSTKKRYTKKTASKPSSGSSVFIYKPYAGKASQKEKSVEQLLREYAEYEARRKNGRSAKKKVNANVPRSEGDNASPAEKKSAGKEKTTKPVTTSHKNSKQSNSNKEIVLSATIKKPKKTSDFTFADAEPDYPDVEQVTAVTTNAPVGLTNDAPLPYVIEENFINDQKEAVDASKSKSSKKPKKKAIGLAGNVYLKKSLGSGKWGIGGSINRKLIKDDYWFARVGWSYSLEEDEDPFSYSWGIGYSDWHAGTFSAQLNNWGPIKMGEGLALDKAIASLGYSVKSDLLKKYRLSLSGALNIPVDGNSSAAVNMRWSPMENWYINASVSQPLEGGGDPKWSYGFGYSDWRPNKFNLQYSNYGPNPLFYHNFQKNGTWSLSYNWKF